MRKTIIFITSLCLIASLAFLMHSEKRTKKSQSADSAQQQKANNTSTSLTETGEDLSVSTAVARVNEPTGAVPEKARLSSSPKLEAKIRESLSKTLNTSSKGLVEERLQDGTVGIDLQGRFRAVPVATVDGDGKVQVTDYTSLPPPVKK